MRAEQHKQAEGILYTDQYQLTMAQLYFRLGLHERPAQFDYFYRRNPDYGAHQAGYCINAGLEWLLDWMRDARFDDDDIAYLRGQTEVSGARVFADDFLEWLRAYGNFENITLRAIPEGRVVHPNVPLAIVQGPLAMAQILETSLLNHLNYPILVATKAERMHTSGRGRLLMEFGLRRAQERGGNAGARAALIGGADFTSNVGLSEVIGLPPKGTHAHSMVQVCMTLGMGELGAFRAYADVYPDNCLLLVDTINTLESGVPNAIRVFEELRAKGHKPVGIRLDSGDLAYLAIQSARMLDAAGFQDTIIVLSNDLDELVIWQIITQIREEAARYGVDTDRLLKRLTYGVGTRLITSWGAPALGGVYKLVALQEQGTWKPALKISESVEKTPNPGSKQVWRLYDARGNATADLVSLDDEDPRTMSRIVLRHPSEREKQRVLERNALTQIEPLLVKILDAGKLVYALPSLSDLRATRQADVERLNAGVKRLVNPHIYHVSLTDKLWNLKQELIQDAMGESSGD